MKFWKRLRWFGRAMFLLLLVGLWVSESPHGDRDSGDQLVSAKKYLSNR